MKEPEIGDIVKVVNIEEVRYKSLGIDYRSQEGMSHSRRCNLEIGKRGVVVRKWSDVFNTRKFYLVDFTFTGTHPTILVTRQEIEVTTTAEEIEELVEIIEPSAYTILY